MTEQRQIAEREMATAAILEAQNHREREERRELWERWMRIYQVRRKVQQNAGRWDRIGDVARVARPSSARLPDKQSKVPISRPDGKEKMRGRLPGAPPVRLVNWNPERERAAPRGRFEVYDRSKIEWDKVKKQVQKETKAKTFDTWRRTCSTNVNYFQQR